MTLLTSSISGSLTFTLQAAASVLAIRVSTNGSSTPNAPISEGSSTYISTAISTSSSISNLLTYTSSPVLQDSQPDNRSIIGPIVGGSVGVALIVATIFALFFVLRRKYAREPTQLYPYPTQNQNQTESNPKRIGNFDLKLPLQHSPEAFASASIGEEVDDPSSESMLISGQSGCTRSVESNTLSASPNLSAVRSNVISSSESLRSGPNVASTPARLSCHSSSDASDSQSTDDRVDLVRTLQNANIRAADIARVMERIGSGVFDEDLTSRAADGTNPNGAPPSYDSLRH